MTFSRLASQWLKPAPQHKIIRTSRSQRGAVFASFALLLFAGIPPAVFGKKSHSSPPRVYDLRPQARIPVAPLGYGPPGEMPAFDYHALVELRFIDANHLLFVFNTIGLLKRDRSCPISGSQRMVRAVVLNLPSGQVERQANWELYDLSDFLWSLGNGRFLLRSCSKLDTFGEDLVRRTFIKASGPIEDVMFSPDRSLLVLEVQRVSGESLLSDGNASAASAAPNAHAIPGIGVVFIRMHPLAAFARGQLPLAGDLPTVNQGVLEALIAPHDHFTLNLHTFQGADGKIASVRSFCSPGMIPLTNQIFVANLCPTKASRVFQAYNLAGGAMWNIPVPENQHYPRFLRIRNGAEFAIESLHATQPLAALDPLSSAVIDAETIDIYDTHTGIHIGSFSTTPVYTAGRNVDFSPDGQRMAVLHNRAIEIYTMNELAKNREAFGK